MAKGKRPIGGIDQGPAAIGCARAITGTRWALQLVPEAAVGDYIIIHAGFAIQRLDPEEAEKTLKLLEELSLLGLQEEVFTASPDRAGKDDQ